MSTFNVDLNLGYMPPAGYGTPALGFAHQGHGQLLHNLAAATQLCPGLLWELPAVSAPSQPPGGICGVLQTIGGLLGAVGNLLNARAAPMPNPFMQQGPATLIGNLLSESSGLLPGLLGTPGSGYGILGGSKPPLMPLLQAGVSPQLAGKLDEMWNLQVTHNIFTTGRRF